MSNKYKRLINRYKKLFNKIFINSIDIIILISFSIIIYNSLMINGGL